MNQETIEDTLDRHEKRLNSHSDKIDKIENESTELRVEIKYLCANINNLTNTIKWFITAIGGGLIGLIFYALQTGLFK